MTRAPERTAPLSSSHVTSVIQDLAGISFHDRRHLWNSMSIAQSSGSARDDSISLRSVMPRESGASSIPRAVGKPMPCALFEVRWLLDRPVKPGADNQGERPSHTESLN